MENGAYGNALNAKELHVKKSKTSLYSQISAGNNTVLATVYSSTDQTSLSQCIVISLLHVIKQLGDIAHQQYRIGRLQFLPYGKYELSTA
jgi:hypothetical protein